LKSHHVALASAALFVSTRVNADASAEVHYSTAPAWVASAPASTVDAKPSDAILRMIYNDTQERVTNGTLESYTAFRVRILKPEALALGNLKVVWSPSAGSANVHFVRIIRDGTVIDVLKEAKLKVIERETGLEQSVLDGNLTATMQVPDLRVGDELEFAATITRNESAFGKHNAGFAQIPANGIPGNFRYRLLWPAASAMTTQLTRDLPATAPRIERGFKTLDVELRDPPSIPDVEGAPVRYNIHRTIEFSDYAGWPDLSKQMWPLFEAASRLAPNSPIAAEAAKIAATSSDPVERAQAALRLVQDQVRYVYVGLNGGNYVPATADETWKRRFGDCKAKTVLLMALLQKLGIKAEPVVVNSKGGDGTNERLPDPELFDHVLVRATIAGNGYWLDGTRLGDRHLDMIPAPEFEWALPLSAAGSELIEVTPATITYPQLVSVVDIDATAGFAKDATWTVKQVLHGDQAFGINTALATISPVDAERAVKAYFRQQLNDVEPDVAGWRYDERHATIVLSMKGKGKVDWDGNVSDGHQLTLIGAGFNPPDKLERPKDQDQSAAWSVTHPKFRCYATTVRLPAATSGFHWTYSAKPVNRRLGGVVYWREAGLQNNIVRTVMSSRSFARELPAAEAAQVNAQIATFNNYMSTVEETSSSEQATASALPFTDEPDWVANLAICSPPLKARQAPVR
jgi:hypothetical protein